MKKVCRNTALALAAFLIAIINWIPFLTTVRAEDTAGGFADLYYRLIDMGDILSDSEEAELLAALDEVSLRQNMDVTIITVESLEGDEIAALADDIYDMCSFGYGADRDGILLLVSRDDRQWHISTCGYGITAFTDAGIQYIGRQMKSDLASENYAAAFRIFIDQCDQFISQARTGMPFDKSSLPKEKMPSAWALISLGGGAAVGLGVFAALRGKMKSVRYAPAANNYVRDGSMNITQSNDVFLYRTVNKTARTKSSGSSTHTSSSGTKHGGGGGSF